MNAFWLGIRSTAWWLMLVLSTLVMGLPVMLVCALSYDAGYRTADLWIRFNLFSLKSLCGLDCRVEGREHIPDKACIVLAKHLSTWETLFLPTVLPRAVFVAKRSLARIPIFGWTIFLLRFIFIDRSAGRSAIAQMTEQSRTAIENGRWVVIFPEGTRRGLADPPDYRIGGAVVAVRLGAPVLPIAHDASAYWPRHGFIKRPGTVTLVIGPPIPTTGRKAEAVMADTRDWIETTMHELPGSRRARESLAVDTAG